MTEKPESYDVPPPTERAAYENASERAYMAIKAGDTAELDRVLAETPRLLLGFSSYTPMMDLAAEYGQAGAIRVLIEFGARATQIDESGGTPLMAAASKGHSEAACTLLAAGADPNVLVEDHCHGGDPRVVGRCALFFALANGHRDLVELLKPVTRAEIRALAYRELPAYLEWKAKNPGPHLPTIHLFMAAQQDRIDQLRESIAAGANINAILEPKASNRLLGSTPLSFAAGRGRMDLVEALLQAGADPGLKDHLGRSAADFAALNGHDEVAARLRSRLRPSEAGEGEPRPGEPNAHEP